MPDLHLKFGNHLKLDDLLPHVQSRECRVAILPAIHAKCHQAPASLLLEFPDHPAQEDYRNIKKVTDSGIGCQFAMELPSLANKFLALWRQNLGCEASAQRKTSLL